MPRPAHTESSSSSSSSSSLLLTVLLVLGLGAVGYLFVGVRSDSAPDPVAMGPSSGDGAETEPLTGTARTADGTERESADRRQDTKIEDPGLTTGEEIPDRVSDSGEPGDGAGAVAVRIRGRVVDQDGAPVVDARLSVTEDPDEASGGMIALDFASMSGRGEFPHPVDADGRFDIPYRGESAFVVVARSVDRPPVELHSVVPDGATSVDELELVLEIGGSVSGHVVGLTDEWLDDFGADELQVVARAEGGAGLRALGFIEVELGEVDPRICEVEAELGERDELGWPFELRGLRFGQPYEIYGVHGSGDSSRRCTLVLSVEAGARGLRLRFDPGMRLVAEVVDAESGEPIEGARFVVGQPLGMKVFGQSLSTQMGRPMEERSDRDGRLTSEIQRSESDGPRSVEVQCDGYFAASLGDQQFAGQNRLDLGVVRLRRSPIVLVRVVDRETGEPIEGASVELEEYVDVSEQMSGLNVQTSFEVNQRNQERSGRWMRSGGPQSRSGETDAEGLCELGWDFPTEAEVTVKADGYALWQVFDLAQPSGSQTVELEAALGQGGRVVLTLLDPDGQPVEGGFALRVRGASAMPSGDNRQVAGPSDEIGQIEFSGLSDGEHRFTRSEGEDGQAEMMSVMMQLATSVDGATGDLPGWISASVADGETVELTLQEPKKSRVRGFVTIGGEPLESATVSLLMGPGSGSAEAEAVEEMMQAMRGGMLGKLLGGDGPSAVRTSFDGDYELVEVPYGSHRLQIDHPDLAMPCILPVEVAAPFTDFDVLVPAGVLIGRVVDENGDPIGSVQVAVTTDVGFDTSDLPGGDSAISSMMGMRDRSIRTAADGRFELRGVRPGRALRLRLRGSYRVSRAVDVETLRAEERRDLGALAMDPAGRILVRCGEGSNFGQVRAVWLGEGELEAPSMGMIQNGSAVLRGLKPGNYRVELVESDGDERSVEVAVTARRTERIDL